MRATRQNTGLVNLPARYDHAASRFEMTGVKRVTETVADELVRDIDRREKRSTFIAEAVRRELDRRRRVELRRSRNTPNPAGAELAEQ
jgi:hypothetical protein